jgi:hypothetical protein
MISAQERKADQHISKALARNPLVLLDQQLQSLAKEETMPYENMAEMEGESLRC